jgi:tRNA (cytidine/uridine-2'-O-)-methyltransferase
VRVFDSLEEWFEKNPAVKPWLVEVGGSTVYTEAAFARGDFVMFGDEQDGIPPSLLEKFPDRHLRIPQQGVRSMNLSNCVSLVAYEALRQLDWLGLEP